MNYPLFFIIFFFIDALLLAVGLHALYQTILLKSITEFLLGAFYLAGFLFLAMILNRRVNDYLDKLEIEKEK